METKEFIEEKNIILDLVELQAIRNNHIKTLILIQCKLFDNAISDSNIKNNLDLSMINYIQEQEELSNIMLDYIEQIENSNEEILNRLLKCNTKVIQNNCKGV